MAKKLYAILFLVAALGLGLWAQSTFITIGGTAIEIPEPEVSGPKVDEASLTAAIPSDMQGGKIQAVYGDPTVVQAMIMEDESMTLKNPLYLAMSVADLDNVDLGDQDISSISEGIAQGMFDGLSGVANEDPDNHVLPLILGEYFRTKYAVGYTILIQEEPNSDPKIIVLAPMLVKGKLLICMIMLDYKDSLSINKAERYARGWVQDIYRVNYTRTK